MGLFSEGSYGEYALKSAEERGTMGSEALGGMLGVKTRSGEIKRLLQGVDASDQSSIDSTYKEMALIDKTVADDFRKTAMENLKQKAYIKATDTQHLSAEHQLGEQKLKALRTKNRPILENDWEANMKEGTLQKWLAGSGLVTDDNKDKADAVDSYEKAISFIRANKKSGEAGKQETALKNHLKDMKEQYVLSNYERLDLVPSDTSTGGDKDTKVKDALLGTANPNPYTSLNSGEAGANVPTTSKGGEAGTRNNSLTKGVSNWNSGTDVTNLTTTPKQGYTSAQQDANELKAYREWNKNK